MPERVKTVNNMERKKITIEDVMQVRKLFENPPPSKVDDLAKLFRPYITGEVYSKIIKGSMPSGVVLNVNKLPDDFLKLAVYSLDKYFNIHWITSGSPESDAVIFVPSISDYFEMESTIKRDFSPQDSYTYLRFVEFSNLKQSAK